MRRRPRRASSDSEVPMKPNIFVPFDFSASADAALAWAADLQRTTGAGPIEMVHAINCRPPGTGEVSVVRRLFLGSIAEHVLRHADCPVVTVHARTAKEGSP